MKRKQCIIILFLICVTALCCLFALTACKGDDPLWYGTYYAGYREGDEPETVVIGKKYRDAGGIYSYTYEKGIMYVNNYKVVLAESYEVHYMLEYKVWSYGTQSISSSSITKRNGYLDNTLYIIDGLGVKERVTFMPDGTYEHYLFYNELPEVECGTYTLNSGVLTLNQTSYSIAGVITQNEKTHRYWYIDNYFNIYVGALLKHPEKFTVMPTDPDTPDPDTPDPDTPDPDTPDPAEKYTLSYTAGEGGRIIGTLNQTVERGGDGDSVIAVANEGYEFIGWSDGVETAERQDTGVTQSISVTAQFEHITVFVSGNGTAARPYQIATAEQLLAVEYYPQAYFVLIEDIEMEGTYTPMFADDNMFNGVFDGNGHKIINLTINNTATFYTGLFACIGKSGAVKNLTLENVNVSGANYVGGIAGYSLGVISDCTVNGSINYIAENSYKVFIGGIAGRIVNLIYGCSADVIITCSEPKGETYIGGIAGCLYLNGKDIDIYDCSSAGEITCTDASSTVYAGGIFGELGASFGGNGLIRSYSTSDLTVTSSSYVYCGGLAGYCNSISVDDSYMTGDINVTSASSSVYCGGLVGYFGSISVDDSYMTGDINVTAGSLVYCGGLVGEGFSSSGDGVSLSIDNSYMTGDINACGGFRIYCGGLAGYSISSSAINNSYMAGEIVVIAAGKSDEVCCGGLAGYSSSSSAINNSYATGDINITAVSSTGVYCGGLVGKGSAVDITSSYTVGKIEVTCEGDYYAGALVGYAYNTFTLTNAHWLYYAESGVEYAVGYSNSIGIPSSIGATKHTDISEFYTLADVLNGQLDEPVWENTDEAALPTLKSQG